MGLPLFYPSDPDEAASTAAKARDKGPGTAHSRSAIRRSRIDQRERRNAERRRQVLNSTPPLAGAVVPQPPRHHHHHHNHHHHHRLHSLQDETALSAQSSSSAATSPARDTTTTPGPSGQTARVSDAFLIAHGLSPIATESSVPSIPDTGPTPTEEHVSQWYEWYMGRIRARREQDIAQAASDASRDAVPPPRRQVPSHLAFGYTPMHPPEQTSVHPAQFDHPRESNVRSIRPRLSPLPNGHVVEGPGDRDMSLDMDTGWFTLVSTITPDPQPPSVGSSFASTVVASTTANSTADATATAPFGLAQSAEPATGLQTVPPIDLICDPARENAEGEGGTAPAPAAEMDTASNDGPRYLPVPTPPPDGDRWTGISSQPDDGLVVHEYDYEYYTDDEDDDDEGDDDHRGDDGDGHAAPRANAPLTHEVPFHITRDELYGMRHIIRLLTQRADIPDEWWAEVGLSRILGGEDSASPGGSRSPPAGA